MRKKVLIAVAIIVVVLVLAIVGLYYLGKSSKTTSNPTKGVPFSAQINVKQGTDDPAKVIDVQKKLAKLFVDYRDAQINTNALLLVNPTKTPIEDYKALGVQVVDQWTQVENDANAIGNLKTAFINEMLGVQTAFAANVNDSIKFDIPFNSNDYKNISIPSDKQLSQSYGGGDTSEVKIVPTKWDQIDAAKKMYPKLKILDAVQNMFGTTAKDAKQIIEDHYNAQTQIYNNQEAFYGKAATTATAINTASKIGLFIGGAIITAGGSAVLTAPTLAAAVSAGAAADIGVVGGTVIVAGGVNTILDIGKNGAVLGFSTEQTAATFSDISDAVQPVTDILAISSLGSGMDDPGNLYTIYDFAVRGYSNLNLNFGDEAITIDNKPTNLKVITPKNIMSTMPKTLTYVDPSTGQEVQTANPARVGEDYLGIYEGSMRIPFAFNGQNFTFDIPTSVTIAKDGSVKFKYSGKGDFSYNAEGIGAMAANWNMNGIMDGKISDKGEISKSEGHFTEWVQVVPPAGTYLPPEIQSRLSNSASGNCSATGSFSSDTISGNVTCAGNGMSYPGTWSAERK